MKRNLHALLALATHIAWLGGDNWQNESTWPWKKSSINVRQYLWWNEKNAWIGFTWANHIDKIHNIEHNHKMTYLSISRSVTSHHDTGCTCIDKSTQCPRAHNAWCDHNTQMMSFWACSQIGVCHCCTPLRLRVLVILVFHHLAHSLTSQLEIARKAFSPTPWSQYKYKPFLQSRLQTWIRRMAFSQQHLPLPSHWLMPSSWGPCLS